MTLKGKRRQHRPALWDAPRGGHEGSFQKEKSDHELLRDSDELFVIFLFK